MANHRKQVTVTKLKKIYSVMNQAISATVAEYGEASDWANDCGSSAAPTCTTEEAMEWFQNYIGKNLQILSITKNPKKDNTFLVYLKDGSILLFTNYIYDITYYTNEKALTGGKYGVNAFAFRFNPILATGQNAEQNKYTVKATFEPYTWSWKGTREDLLNNTEYGCNGKKNHFCTKLIQYEGWQIPKDYPLRF